MLSSLACPAFVLRLVPSWPQCRVGAAALIPTELWVLFIPFENEGNFLRSSPADLLSYPMGHSSDLCPGLKQSLAGE